MTKNFRFEKDSMGTIEVPMEALWGAQTQRSIINFSIGEELIPIELIYSQNIEKDNEIMDFIDQSDLEECFNPSIHLNNLSVIWEKLGI